jgi:hypothetical protein
VVETVVVQPDQGASLGRSTQRRAAVTRTPWLDGSPGFAGFGPQPGRGWRAPWPRPGHPFEGGDARLR